MKIKFIIIIILLLAPTKVFATKPCPQSPCFTKSQFDKEKCIEVSDWMAIGKIENVIHNYKGHPLNKDFASFTFIVETWEKGEGQIQKKLYFSVGWCHNPADFDTEGSFLVTLKTKHLAIQTYIKPCL